MCNWLQRVNIISVSFISYVQQGNVSALTAHFESTSACPEAVMMCVHIHYVSFVTLLLIIWKFSFRSSPLPDTSGFIEKSNMGITVHMNVLLPIDMWDFDQKKSEVFVCFGHQKLGDWKPVKKLNIIR